MKKKRILVICFIVILIFIALGQSLYAADVDWDKLNEAGESGNTENVVYSVMGSVINIVTIIGAGTAIIMLVWLAIRFMNTYTPIEKAEVKRQIPIYVTGAIILFSASAIVRILYSFVTDNINSSV